MSPSAALKQSLPRVPERLPAPPRESFYASIGARDEPTIFVNAMNDWPAMKKWSFDWFIKEHGETVVPVEWLKYSRSEDPGLSTRVGHVKSMKVREYVENMLKVNSPEAGYLIGKDLLGLLPSLLEDMRFPRYQSNNRLTEQLFFMGPRGTFTQLHYDRAHNMHAVFVGRKRWQLYSPERSAELRPTRLGFVWSVVSYYDLVPEGGNPEQLPNNAVPDYDFVLEAGEILYLPYGWWHRVLTVEPSIATNLWWWTLPMLARLGPKLIPSLVSSTLKNIGKQDTRRGYYGRHS